MAKVASKTLAVEVSLTVTLNEAELRAFDALTCYGFDSFLQVFKKQLGEAYMRGNEGGLKSLWALRGEVQAQLRHADDARRDIREAAERKLRVRVVGEGANRLT